MKKPWVYILCLFLIGPGMALAQTETAGEKEKSPWSGRLEFVFKLLEHSSAAQRIKASKNPQAEAMHEEARALYIQALEASKRGDKEVVEEALFHASEMMFKAARLAEQVKAGEQKERTDFERRMDSVKALLEAHERVSKEKKTEAADTELHRVAEAKIAKADSLKDEGHLQDARKVLDEAYVAVKIAVSELRQGDVLVRSLHFETKEEEYRYELDRNDTHQLLVKILLEEKLKSERVRRVVQPFVDKAAEVRAEGERQAAQGDYEKAVETLERSTKELLRAIRAAGLYIPG